MLSETILSAYIKYFKKDDDCYENLLLTQFRDDYMLLTEKGKKLLKEYYAIAPKIVEAIEASDRKNIYYLYIREVIDKCVIFIEKNANVFTLNEYRFMVENLKKEFNL